MSSPGRTLVLGPYAGEFGWELGCWNPRARYLADAHYGPVTVQAPAASRYLYEFADEFEPVEVVPGTSEDVRGEVAPDVAYHADCARVIVGPDRALFEREKASWTGRLEPWRKSWRKLGTEPTSSLPSWVGRGVVAAAFRPPKEHRGKVYGFKAWPRERCEQLVHRLYGEHGFVVAAVGGFDNWCFGPMVDFRGALSFQCGLLARARLCVGPSSGAVHLAALCGCRVVTWYDQPNTESSRLRYLNAWNPFGAPVTYLRDRQPSVDDVLAAVLR